MQNHIMKKPELQTRILASDPAGASRYANTQAAHNRDKLLAPGLLFQEYINKKA